MSRWEQWVIFRPQHTIWQDELLAVNLSPWLISSAESRAGMLARRKLLISKRGCSDLASQIPQWRDKQTLFIVKLMQTGCIYYLRGEFSSQLGFSTAVKYVWKFWSNPCSRRFLGMFGSELNVLTFIINSYSLSDPKAYWLCSAVLNKTTTQLASSPCQLVRHVCTFASMYMCVCVCSCEAGSSGTQ